MMSDYTEDQEFDESFSEVHDIIWQVINGLAPKYDPLLIAAVLSTTGLGLYKSVLKPEDYDRMVDTIVNLKDEVNSFDQNTGYLN